MTKPLLSLLLLGARLPAVGATLPDCSPEHAAATVAALDTAYQAAVAKNDAATMDRLLADDFILVTGKGVIHPKADLLAEARGGHVRFEHQEDTLQTVRVWGRTAVITARLWVKGTQDGQAFDYTLWFSDVYVCGANGWRYSFGQAAQPLAPTG